MEQRKSTDGTNVYYKRKRGKYFELCIFSKLCHIVTYYSELNKTKWAKRY